MFGKKNFSKIYGLNISSFNHLFFQLRRFTAECCLVFRFFLSIFFASICSFEDRKKERGKFLSFQFIIIFRMIFLQSYAFGIVCFALFFVWFSFSRMLSELHMLCLFSVFCFVYDSVCWHFVFIYSRQVQWVLLGTVWDEFRRVSWPSVRVLVFRGCHLIGGTVSCKTEEATSKRPT